MQQGEAHKHLFLAGNTTATSTYLYTLTLFLQSLTASSNEQPGKGHPSKRQGLLLFGGQGLPRNRLSSPTTVGHAHLHSSWHPALPPMCGAGAAGQPERHEPCSQPLSTLSSQDRTIRESREHAQPGKQTPCLDPPARPLSGPTVAHARGPPRRFPRPRRFSSRCSIARGALCAHTPIKTAVMWRERCAVSVKVCLDWPRHALISWPTLKNPKP